MLSTSLHRSRGSIDLDIQKTITVGVFVLWIPLNVCSVYCVRTVRSLFHGHASEQDRL